MKGLTRLNGCQNRRYACEFRVEIARIGGTGDLRLEWGLNSLVVDIVPVDISEERLAHDFLGIRRSTSETLIWFSGQELLEDCYGVSRHVDWI